jgi:hypothetical protein
MKCEIRASTKFNGMRAEWEAAFSSIGFAQGNFFLHEK